MDAVAVDQRLGELVRRYRLMREAEWLRARLVSKAREVASDTNRHTRIWDAIRRLDDRISRRQWTYNHLLTERPIVTTTQVACWVRANIANYRVVGGADPVELAGEVTNALNLWDEHGSIPGWVHGVCEREVTRDRKVMAYSRNFFVEKQVQYEPNGDVLWA